MKTVCSLRWDSSTSISLVSSGLSLSTCRTQHRGEGWWHREPVSQLMETSAEPQHTPGL